MLNIWGTLEESAKTERKAREVAGKQESRVSQESNDQMYQIFIQQKVLPFPLKVGEIATCFYNEILWGRAGGDNPE